jgi:hypothetical protein
MTFIKFTLTLLLSTVMAFAYDFTPNQAQHLEENILKDGGFETGKSNWTVSAGTASLISGIKNSKALRVALSSQTLGVSQISTLHASDFNNKSQGLIRAIVRANFSGAYMCPKINGTSISSSEFSSRCVEISSDGDYDLYKLPIILGGTSSGVEFVTSGNVTGNFDVDDVFVGITNVTDLQPLIGPWTSYTPVFSAGFGTVTNISAEYRQVGSSIEVRGTGTSGAVAASVASISLPTGLPIGNVPEVAGGSYGDLGTWNRNSTDGSTYERHIIGEQGGTVVYMTKQDGTRNPFSTQNGNIVLGSTEGFYFRFSYPSSGVSSFTNTITASSKSYQSYSIYQDGNAMTTIGVGQVQFNLGTATIRTGGDSDLFTVSNVSSATRVTALKSIKINVHWGYKTAGTADNASIYKNGSVFFSGPDEASSAAHNSVVVNMELEAGDYITFHTTSGVRNTGDPAGVSVMATPVRQAIVGDFQQLQQVATISDVKASGGDGGTATSGSYQTRTLNTLSDPLGIVTSLSSNQFTLPAGTYHVEANAPGYAVGRHKIKLRNVTDGSDAIIGSSENSTPAAAVQTRSHLNGIVTITSSKTFELQHRVNTTAGTNGFGVSSVFGDSETYSIVKIRRLK